MVIRSLGCASQPVRFDFQAQCVDWGLEPFDGLLCVVPGFVPDGGPTDATLMLCGGPVGLAIPVVAVVGSGARPVFGTRQGYPW